MATTKTRLPSNDFTTDIAYDYFGTRLATACMDHFVRVFVKHDGSWTLVSTLAGHKASVLSISWANPDFGQLLASCSLDKTVCVWEEVASTFSLNTEGILIDPVILTPRRQTMET